MDNLDVQKLVPTFKYGWSALVAFTGVAVHPRYMPDTGDWIAQQLHSIDRAAPFEELPKALLAADEWLSKISGKRQIAFSVVGFVGRKPFAMLISNYLTLSGQAIDPVLPELRIEEERPKKPCVFVAGDSRAVTREEREQLGSMLRWNRHPREIHTAMAAINAAAVGRTTTISRECVTGHLLASGTAEITPQGISEHAEYMPRFVMRDLAAVGVHGVEQKRGADGKPLPVQWVGMTANSPGGRKGERIIANLHALRNVQRPLEGEAQPNTAAFWKVAGPDEPERYTFHFDRRADK